MVKTELSLGFLSFCFFCQLASMIVNFYHRVTNKFPYHSTCFEMYTVT